MIGPALSNGWYVDRLMRGPRQAAIGLGHGHIKVASYVVTVTSPGAPRMPNGVECEMRIEAGESAWLGGGALAIEGLSVTPGPVWDAAPRIHTSLDIDPRPVIRPDRLMGKVSV